ncbi:MAG TPA: HU family DNA-binding protein [Nitrospiraceae bacterium]|nr:HU family DNA-binding protein [Nitrospiraceae bacterium]
MGEAIKRSDIVNHIASVSKEERSKAERERTVDAVFSFLKDCIAHGTPVRISGFGTWTMGFRKARKGVHPKNQTVINIPASKTVKFKASKELKMRLNSSK